MVSPNHILAFGTLVFLLCVGALRSHRAGHGYFLGAAAGVAMFVAVVGVYIFFLWLAERFTSGRDRTGQ